MQNISNTVTDTFSHLKPWLQKVTTQTKTTDSKYFTTTKKGEIYELKAELTSENRQKKKEAVKKVIASMTVGKDVSSLFTDVINCMQTDNLELKKLVYLYLMNYAKSQQDNAIMAVNTFVKDCDDPNPLIRALAVRTMGCCRVEKITAYLCDPLRKCLKDEDPYVRKTAAICVAKLHDIDASMVEDGGFLTSLKDLLSDSNPMVVANAVAAITEILDSSRLDSVAHEILAFNQQIINKMLTALSECTEWGQIFILDAISSYEPGDQREAQNICERISPRLAHANAAVVLSAVRVILKMLELLSRDNEFTVIFSKKLAPPLVTLLSAEPEIQYVALRNINLISQKRPDILKQEMKVFFVKYNDPIYVKLEKLDIMIRLTNASNIAQVLSELKEYAKEVDVDFVRKSVRAIGRCAIKVESAAERCVSTLIDLIQTKVNYVVQEAIVVIKDIFRKYPNRYESIIATLCENLDTLDEPEARASMIWIVGEYADRIDNADELLENFLESFQDENSQVQLQLLTAIVKLFLKRPAETQDLVQNVLHLSTQESDNPDLRDRGYIYWRLLSTDPAAAKAAVLAEKPLISEETDLLEPTLLDELVCHIGSLASVYHKPPNAFVEGKHITRRHLPSQLQNATNADASNADKAITSSTSGGVQPSVIPNHESLIGDLLELDPYHSDHSYQSTGVVATQSPLPAGTISGNVDLLGDGLEDLIMGGPSGSSSVMNDPQLNRPSTTSASQSDPLADIFGDLAGICGSAGGGGLSGISLDAVADFCLPKEIWLDRSNGKGLEVEGTFYRRSTDKQICMDLTITNRAMQPMFDFAIQFNKNSFGLTPAQALVVACPMQPNQSAHAVLPLNTTGPVTKMQPLMTLQVAIKNNIDILYFACPVPIHVLFVEDGEMEKFVFLATWKDIPPQNENQYILRNIAHGADSCCEMLKASNIFTIAKRNLEGQDMLYQSAKLTNGIWVLAELKLEPGNSNLTLSLKSRTVDVYPSVEKIYNDILSK